MIILNTVQDIMCANGLKHTYSSTKNVLLMHNLAMCIFNILSQQADFSFTVITVSLPVRSKANKQMCISLCWFALVICKSGLSYSHQYLFPDLLLYLALYLEASLWRAEICACFRYIGPACLAEACHMHVSRKVHKYTLRCFQVEKASSSVLPLHHSLSTHKNTR